MRQFINEIREHSREYGSIPFWSWNDRLQPDELRRQINVMHKLGMNGFFMHARGGLETEYLSEEWYDCIRACVDEAEKLGMEAWSYDENGWPSGFAGGELLKDKTNWATYLKYETSEAFPQGENILGVYVIQDGVCRRVHAPEAGAKEYHCVIQCWDESYVDTLRADITEKFIAATHEEYKKRVGFSKNMPGFFTDEPQYYRWGTPWSDKMPEEFSARWGYDVLGLLPALFTDFDGAEEFRWDYYRLCHELFINGFIKVIYDWCEANGCQLTGHAVEESTLAGQMWCIGGVMPFYAYEHIPGIDYLGRYVQSDIAARQLGSACAQLGKKKAISEMYGCCGWDVTPNELKRIADVQYVNGVNLMCQHLYPYSIRGQRKTDYPCHYSEHLPWQDKLGAFNEYYNHLGYILSRGTEQTRVLVIHPIHAAYLTYKRAEDAESIRELQDDLFALNSLLSENQIPYHFGDEWMMQSMASVEGGRIRVGQCAYDRVVVPAMDTLDESTVRLLKEYLSSGGKVYLFGKAPTRVNGRRADLSWLKSTCSFGDIAASADVTLRKDGKNIPQLRQMTRMTESGRAIYITNLTGDTIENVSVTVKNCESLCALDLNTLELYALPCARENGGCTAVLTFGDSQGWLLLETAAPAPMLTAAPAGESIPLTGRFTLASRPENMMTLDCAEISYDGVTYEKSRPVIMIRDLLLRAKYRGELYLKFSFHVDEIPGSLRVAVEPMRYLSASVNGAPIALDGGWWLDRSFRTADIAPHIRTGRNEIVLQIDYFQRDYVYYVLYSGVSESLRNCLSFDTEIESIYLTGHFRVNTDESRFTCEERSAVCYDGGFSIAAQTDEIDPTDFVRSGYPFFGGAIEVQTSYAYTPGGATALRLNGRFSVCDVRVNGQFAGTMLFSHAIDLAPWLVEGENEIRLTFFNTLRNLLGPHHGKTAESYSIGPRDFTFENMWDGENCPHFRDRYAFVRFGIDL
ncbi:MAG: hypothetical protein IJO98_09815 [Clostridia bacterium]|nr:hypothetical protein [Clostridia bacterium]